MQTEETTLFPRLDVRRPPNENGVQLDARRLAELRAGLPGFPAPGEARAPPPLAVAVAVVGAQIPL